MAAVLDANPYPWHEQDAVVLHRTLYQNVPRSQRAAYFASVAGINTGLVNLDQPPFDVWYEILNLAAASAKMRALVTALRADPSLTTAHPLFDALLDSKPPVSDREPAGTTFLRKDDQVAMYEALLFHDDLTLSTGRMGWLIEVLQRLRQLAPAVCRLEVVSNNDSQSGTGFRIGEDLLLTNWHVPFIEGKAATAITAEFNFEHDAGGAALAAVPIACHAAPVYADQADDWGVLRVQQPMPAETPRVDLTFAAEPVLQTPAFIIQHPGGGRKKVAFVRNHVTYFDDRVVHYLSDTQVGSSGAPVFDEQGRLIALHHKGGRPQEVAGKTPVKKNEGIRITRIVTGLKAAGLI